jgi:L-aminopeptidase/D-esterase-like protein
VNVEHGIEGLRIGVAELDGEPTGCTVLAFDDGALSSCDVRGGAPGVVGAEYQFVNAVVFAGGSLLGLGAVAGVADAVHESKGRGIDWLDIPAVGGSIIFDYVEGRTWRYPDPALGAAAFRAAEPGLAPVGRVGAGRSATAGKMAPGPKTPSGQGAAAWTSADGDVHVLVVTVVNAVGSLVDRDGTVVLGPDPRVRLGELETELRPGNTTLTAVVTDARLRTHELRQLGRQVHSSMARAIQPFHGSTDGDVLWALSTGRSTATVNADVLAWRASEVAWDAVLSVVPS